MNDQLGLSFLPTADANGLRGGEAGPAGARLEDILKIISLRLPKFLGSKAIAPQELLQSPGGAALPSGGGHGGDVLADTIARSVLQNIPGFAPSAPGGMSGGGGAADPFGSFQQPAPPPTNVKPRIVPIENPPAPGGDAGYGFGSGASDRIDERMSTLDQLRGRRRIN